MALCAEHGPNEEEANRDKRGSRNAQQTAVSQANRKPLDLTKVTTTLFERSVVQLFSCRMFFEEYFCIAEVCTLANRGSKHSQVRLPLSRSTQLPLIHIANHCRRESAFNGTAHLPVEFAGIMFLDSSPEHDRFCFQSPFLTLAVFPRACLILASANIPQRHSGNLSTLS